MSKLDGNERWKSKLLLTEHADQYDQYEQQRDTPRNNLITSEERIMLRDYILLPHIETMVQKSLSEVEYSVNILKRSYLMAGQYIMEKVIQDQHRLRREMKQRNIKILHEEQSELVVYYRYYCRGYEERFGITRDVMRTEISLRLTRYIAELGVLLKERVREASVHPIRK